MHKELFVALCAFYRRFYPTFGAEPKILYTGDNLLKNLRIGHKRHIAFITMNQNLFPMQI